MQREFIGYTKGVKLETDEAGEVYFNGNKGILKHVVDDLYAASGLIYRYKKPKRVIGARKRKKALAASVRKYAISVRFHKED